MDFGDFSWVEESVGNATERCSNIERENKRTTIPNVRFADATNSFARHCASDEREERLGGGALGNSERWVSRRGAR